MDHLLVLKLFSGSLKVTLLASGCSLDNGQDKLLLNRIALTK